MSTYQVLARKWRPKTFEDVLGQNHITRSLQNALKRNRVGHAYLFTGTRGIGKTSIARIFAKALRCENLTAEANPCGQCQACLDFHSTSPMNFFEIDGASNNSVDNIRELISNINYLPTNGKYKIYLIDEVHMLSQSAFNALLKTLEEPPQHVIFLFATTAPEKLLDTVISRCQRFDLRNASMSDLTEHIKKIGNAEGITFESDSLIKQLCLQGRGSIRDTLSLFDQVISFSTNGLIDELTLSSGLGIAKVSLIRELFSSILKGHSDRVSEIFNQFISENIAPKNILTGLLDEVYFMIQSKRDESAELFWIFETLTKDSTWIFDGLIPDKALHLVLLKVSKRGEFFSTSEKKKDASRPVTKTYSWPEFLNYLSGQSQAASTYLKHGNLISEKNWGELKDRPKISLAFAQKDHIMFDYLNTPEMRQKIKAWLSQYTERDESFFEELEIELLDSEKEKTQSFKSVVEEQVEQEKKLEEQQKQAFLNRAEIVEMQKLFQTKIDHVILRDDKK